MNPIRRLFPALWAPARRGAGARAPRGALAGAVLRVVMLVALMLSGTIPQGMMRATGEDGARLVLCTGEGPREIWMAADGSVSDAAPGSQHKVSSCLAVSLSFAGLEMPVAPSFRAAERAPEPARPAPMTAPVRAPNPAHAPRAPPVFL